MVRRGIEFIAASAIRAAWNTEAGKRTKFVLTTTNNAMLHKVAGPEIEAFELSEKPYDLDDLVQSVKRILGLEAA